MTSLIIYQGDNSVVVLQKIKELKQKFGEGGVSTFSLKSNSFEQIMMELATPSFFAEKRLAIIEEAEEKKVDLGKIPEDSDLTVLFIFKKELASSSSLLKEANKRKAQIVSFSQPQDKSIFTFLDLLGDKNKKALEYFEKLYADFGGVYLLTMLIFLLRRLVLPVGSAPAFIAQKLVKQKKNFSEDKLKELYKAVLETEFKIKTGKVEEKSALLLLIHGFVNK